MGDEGLEGRDEEVGLLGLRRHEGEEGGERRVHLSKRRGG